MNVLVAGGGGYIGSIVVEQFVNQEVLETVEKVSGRKSSRVLAALGILPHWLLRRSWPSMNWAGRHSLIHWKRWFVLRGNGIANTRMDTRAMNLNDANLNRGLFMYKTSFFRIGVTPAPDAG